MMLSSTEAWNQQCEHWTELFPELQKALLDNQKNIGEAFGRDALSLQGSMMCEQESNGRRKTFWEFGFKGQMCLRFDSKSRRWAELHPGCSSLKDTLDDNSDISRCLGWISNGNCVKLLNQSTVLNTKAAPIMATTTAPAPAPSKAVIIKDNIALILTLIFKMLLRSSSECGVVPHVSLLVGHLSIMSSCSPVTLQELQPLQPPEDCGATEEATCIFSTRGIESFCTFFGHLLSEQELASGFPMDPPQQQVGAIAQGCAKS
ncbi:UL16-binding protein 6-like [Phyllostomus discolor]|uniref:UL16-binding protein 6-like n=1 Tax=Phyllostomus discolor TaxID=89673 RepID=A0A7E6DHJ4_9CHIR|nr:UL16-binding protein 6-like [Phyllostomus discolor]